ncbi:hypothetical protein IFM89_021705 [Coptis chinensis]|uniref:Uncharacterized protein n=1 Tax=Coptis chinensis TaxID=261450 RepID=A0A835IWY9_9MAGN|nr:hypothetical protein IFM89_021705 [Coptis chinensis]
MGSDIEAQSSTATQLKEMNTAEDENAPKARKPYTISKQRERWTEEEHKKFLEALKLYGRAWRRIEEHVGTKTAVQIRSHAQKFFSKVVRESSNTDDSPVKAIEIPPPRPKRKPMHPYPRKPVHTVNKKAFVSQEAERSPSPNSSATEEENQSPKSEISAAGSDTLGSTISDQNGSQSPISSIDAKPVRLQISTKDNIIQSSTSEADEENGSPTSVLTNSASTTQDRSPMKVDSSSKDNASKAESPGAETPTMSLKLFGRTVLVTDSHRRSSSLTGTSKSSAAESHKENMVTDEAEPAKIFHQNSVENVYSMGSWPHGNPSMFYQMQLQSGNQNPVAGSSVLSVPWWALQGGLPFTFFPSFNMNSVQIPPSWTGSNTSSASEVGSEDKCDDAAESINQEVSSNNNSCHGYGFVLKPSKRSAFSPLRASPNKCIKGFVPYKRCLAEREDQSSTMVGEERDGQSIRLCL